MATAIVNGVSFESDAPCEKHTVTWNGSTFTAGSYLLAALFAFQEWLDKKHPGYYLHVLQGAYNTGVKLSAGTHDKDGVVDVAIINRKTGKRYWLGQSWLRSHHFYAWLRNTGSWFSMSAWHYHMIVVGIDIVGCPVGIFIPGQIADARSGRSGLKGHILDRTWRPPVYTPFPYKLWVENQEEDMAGPKDWDAADWAAFDKHVRTGIEDGFTKKLANGLTIRQTVVRIGTALKIVTPSKEKR